jgi:alpha-galactosidase
LKAAGYQYIVIDYCWADSVRNASGHLVPMASKFPSGMKMISDSVHALGLKFGMYECPTLTTCCTIEPGSYMHESTDAQMFASWGIDYLKYDWCGVQSKEDATSITPQQIITRYVTMREAIKATGRPIVFALCEKGQKSHIQPATWSDTVGHMWRIRGDIAATWARIFQQVDSNASLAKYAGPTKGWNDPDMLEVGNGSLTANENITHFSMWCIMASPLMLGNDPSSMSTTVKNILTNTEAIAIDQDSLGAQGVRIKRSGNQEVWVKPLQNGDRAVVLLNRDPAASATIAINWTDSLIKWPATTKVKVRDLWLKKDSLNVTTGFSAVVPFHSVVMLRLNNPAATRIFNQEDGMHAENLRNVRIVKTAHGFTLYVPGRVLGNAEIANIQGRTIGAFPVQTGWNSIPSNMLPSGIYFVRVTTMHKTNAVKVVNYQ